MAAGGGKEANYWPGFVDALSNVVVVMVFVLVVFTIALIHFSQNKAKEIMAMAAAEKLDQTGSLGDATIDSQTLGERLAAKFEALLRENQRLREEAEARDPLSADAADRAAAKDRSDSVAPAASAGRDASAATRDAEIAEALEELRAQAKRSPSEATAGPPATSADRATAAQAQEGEDAITETVQARAEQLEAALAKALARVRLAEQQAASASDATRREAAARARAEEAAKAAAQALTKATADAQANAAALADARTQAERQERELAQAKAQARAYSARAASEAREGGGAPTLAQAGAIERSEVNAEHVATEAGTTQANASISGNQSSLAISFPRGTFELTDKTRELLDAAYTKLAQGAATKGVTLVAAAETGPYSEGRRLSYYRNLEIRNWLIEKGVPAAKIQMRIAEKGTGGDRGVVQLSVGR